MRHEDDEETSGAEVIPLRPTLDDDHAGPAEQEQPGGSAKDVGAAAQPGRRVRRWQVVAVAAVIALLAWWVSAHVLGDDAPPSRPGAVLPSGASPSGTAAAGNGPERIARDYEALSLAARVEEACRLDIKPAACRAGFGSSPVAYTLSEPVHVLQSQALVRGGVGGEATSTAVLVAFAIQGEQERRVALLVRDGLVIDREPIGSDNAGMSLADLFGETS